MNEIKKRCWSQSFGDYGAKVRLAERTPAGMLYVLWVDHAGKQRKLSLGHRDRLKGREEVRAIAEQLRRRRDQLRGLAAPRAVESLTLRDGVDLALRPSNATEGLYGEDSRHVRESIRLLDRAMEILDEDLPWIDLTPRKVDGLVRTLAIRSERGRGFRTAEYMVDMLYTVAAWLRDEGVISDRAAVPRRNWKARMRKEWERMTHSSTEPNRPRYSLDEARQLFRALPQADPRLALVLQLAMELRVGQAARARRSDLSLDRVGAYGLGRFRVRGVGRKAGEVVDLHPELRSYLDDVLTFGYLSDVEAAFRAGSLREYSLFPVGPLMHGKASVEQSVGLHLQPRTLRGMFERLEQAAGVDHVPGRGFYGLRRVATDLAADLEQDDRVLNRLTGHRDSDTRKRIYQDREHAATSAQAARTRRNLRQQIVGGTTAPE